MNESKRCRSDVGVHLHLVSMPWSAPLRPSIQTAALRSYVASLNLPYVDVSDYSPSLLVPINAAGGRFSECFAYFSSFEEIPYLFLYLRRFIPHLFDARKLEELLSESNKLYKRSGDSALSFEALDELENATLEYIRQRILPNIEGGCSHVVGFTCNYYQVYASFYVQKVIEEESKIQDIHFIYGGSSTSLPTFHALGQRLGLYFTAFIGEGEVKLKEFLTNILNKEDNPKTLGTYTTLDQIDLCERDERNYRSQIQDIAILPLPDFKGFFSELEESCEDESARLKLKASVTIMAEGSRGCFAHCDFCGLNYTWDSFRASKADFLIRRVEELSRTYGVDSVFFTDNVCDTWAEQFAEQIIESGIDLNYFMELRSHHPERFWALLAMAGVSSVQIGVETLAPNLIKAIGKGTKVSQNIIAHRNLSELGITNGANLITHHPKSTLEDVSFTQMVLKSISHLQHFTLSPFALSLGSPIYSQLSQHERQQAVFSPWDKTTWPGELADYQIDWRLGLPDSIKLSPHVLKAWDQFSEGYIKRTNDPSRYPETLKIRKTGVDRYHIYKDKEGIVSEIVLSGWQGRLYNMAYDGISIEKASALFLACDKSLLQEALKSMIDKDIMLEVDGQFISLATRSRDTIYKRWFNFVPKQKIQDASKTDAGRHGL